MDNQPTSAVAARVSTPSGLVVGIPEGSRLVFGRGPDADLTVAAGRGLSRRAGVISAVAGGAWIANISRTHALYTEGEGYRIRLPRMDENGEPSGGWFLRAGTALVGSRAMLDEGQPLSVMVAGRGDWGAGDDGARILQDGDPTLLPLYLDPMTKLFLVALMWCRPWLLDPAATSPLPRTPEIARAALEVTGAHHELERFDTDPEFRDRLAARVAEHIKVLRHKITERGLAGQDVRLSDEVAVRVLIEHGVVSAVDLRLLAEPAWCSRQEDLWWTRELRRGLRCGAYRVDAERGASAAPAGSGHHRAVRPRRDRAAEEIVPLIDRVVEGSMLVGHRAHRRDAHAGQPDSDRRAGDEAAAMDHVHRGGVTEWLADAQLRCAAGRRGDARRRRRGPQRG